MKTNSIFSVKLMIDSVVFYFADDSEDKRMDPERMKDLSDVFNLAVVNAFKDQYPILGQKNEDVHGPGPWHAVGKPAAIHKS